MLKLKTKLKLKKLISSTKKNIKTKTKPVLQEFEAKFLDIDYDIILNKIKSLGGVNKQKNTIFRRSVFGLCDIKRGYVRVRDEGNKITMTSKIYKDPKFPDEYEIEIKDSFDKGKAFLQSLNLSEKAYHETMRETWRIPFGKKSELCEIAIDRIPGLPLYIEIECKSESDLNKSIKLLEMDKSKIGYGAYGKVFDIYYGISQSIMDNEVPKLTFNNIKNELKPYIKKGEDVLDTIYKKHLEIYNSLKK